MNILIVGNGGREHALAWKIAQSPRVSQVFVAPGNAGTAMDAENVDIPVSDIAGMVKFATKNQIDLTVVGPEAPLCAGMVDAFTDAKLRVFGPSSAAAQLEGSKVFCKKMLRNADVPSADFHVFDRAEIATRFIMERFPSETEEVRMVVKADGLAAGKGVIVCSKRHEAL
jgi:phosphoribosylamine--glycine ligase